MGRDAIAAKEHLMCRLVVHTEKFRFYFRKTLEDLEQNSIIRLAF